MTCPYCGGSVSAAGGHCSTCSRPLLPASADARPGVPRPGLPIDAPTSPPAPGDDFTRLTPARDEDEAAPTRLAGTDPDGSGAGDVEPLTGSADTGPLAVGQPFGRRYLVIKVLGMGGMGAVYQVWDSELGQAVALKVIRPEAAGDPAVARELERRFKQELVLARQVTHKNVVRIHDLGEINGIKYITMPFLDGSDLARVLKSVGKLPVSAALRIVRDIASGLVAAHEAGIVHRDLKPANIMLVGEQAIIMDFGIARSATAEGAAQGAAVSAPWQMRGLAAATTASTVAGTTLGTVEYMAPEQAKGETVDQRADVYALGLMFSDMLLGKRRRPAGSALEELRRRIEQAPPPVRTVDPTIPEALEAIISRCLEPDPAARFATSAELLAELNRLDENGQPLPVRRVVGVKVMVAAVALFFVLLAGTWWVARTPVAPVQHDPVSVLIADFDNSTGDATFTRTLEPMLKLALEGGGFISAYGRTEIPRTLGVRPPDAFGEEAARQMALQQGLGVVLAGGIGREGSRYTVSLKAVRAVTGEVIADVSGRASGKDQVLPVATGLASEVREALGDQESDSAKRFAMETLSATSLDVVREYAAAMEALSRSQFDEARAGFSRALALDPGFGLGYLGLATTSRNLDRQQEAIRYAKEAVSHTGSMTEREVYRTRGLYYLVTNDYHACVREYGDLIARYAADAAARNNLALCATYLRDMPRALDEMRQVVKILPNRALYRENLALYSSYSGDFAGGEREARSIAEPGLFSQLALAFAQLGQGQVREAAATYAALGSFGPQGKSYMASGLGDLAMYEGRYADAEATFSQGAAADLAADDPDRAAAKLAALSRARILRGRTRQAVAAVDEALKNSQAVKIRFLAARVLVDAGELTRASALAEGLASELQAEPQAYGKIVAAGVALKGGDPRQAVRLLTESTTLLDTWIGHYDLGRAYLEAGAPLQADSEFDRCLNRRGEALSLFLDEEPTFGSFPAVHYYQGRAREALRNAGYADSYRGYLAARGASAEDPLAADVRGRLGL